MLDLPINNISHLIPQKPPFEMVDALLGYSETSVISSLTIKEDDVFVVEGRFTEEGLVENMAQSVALHTGYSCFLEGKEAPVGYIGSIKSIHVFQLPRSGETITSHVTILHEFMGVTMVEVLVKLGDTTLATSEMKTVIAK
ncbi:hypothetical protein [Algoriphagus chordae]|uniref:Putative hotdog family 3-hydroxylacyl-ACP dehydratase n=1 Tax=Algoriphagus chordae TaxID=237019 RepID=A0A2W7QRS3_9BACT|nr:hypothetical protein [Algoriphagus chordae]PZX48730.1 putative hotdog family 3-hydroxylacyl-ACP dehydratase [Algoriphagus chordae]